MAVTNNYQAAFPLPVGDLTVPGYAALYALGINLTLSLVLTLFFGTRGKDETKPSDYNFRTHGTDDAPLPVTVA